MSKRNRQNGQSLVELVPLMFLFLVNVVNFSGCFLAYPVKAASSVGAYIMTPDRSYSSTVLHFTFQYDPEYLQSTPVIGDPTSAVTMRAKFVRSGCDGVGVPIIHLNEQDRPDFQNFLPGAWPRRTA